MHEYTDGSCFFETPLELYKWLCSRLRGNNSEFHFRQMNELHWRITLPSMKTHERHALFVTVEPQPSDDKLAQFKVTPPIDPPIDWHEAWTPAWIKWLTDTLTWLQDRRVMMRDPLLMLSLWNQQTIVDSQAFDLYAYTPQLSEFVNLEIDKTAAEVAKPWLEKLARGELIFLRFVTSKPKKIYSKQLAVIVIKRLTGLDAFPMYSDNLDDLAAFVAHHKFSHSLSFGGKIVGEPEFQKKVDDIIQSMQEANKRRIGVVRRLKIDEQNV